jgi:periplasmic protein TonB
MKPLLFLPFVFFCLNASAQDTTFLKAGDDSFEKEFTSVQVPAEFPGGNEGWNDFLTANMKPDTPAKYKAPAGIYTVIVSFSIDKEGQVKNIAILENPGYGTAEDVIRVIRKSPRWKPAMQNGRNVVYVQKQRITYQVD